VPTLVDVATLRTHVETDLLDPAVQRLLDDADAAIVARYGPNTGNITVDLQGAPFGEAWPGLGIDRLLFPNRAVTAVVSITEYRVREDPTGVLLDATDYRLLYGGMAIERLTTGPNGRSTWGERVVITYTPDAQTARRILLEIDLVRLAVQYTALRAESIGDWRGEHPDYEAERERMLRRLRPAISFA
jgi:hypothetical protein